MTVGCAALFAAALTARAAAFQTVCHFEAPPYEPEASLVMATNGLLSGTTYSGGAHGQGAIFNISTNGMYSNVWAFTGGTNGGMPFVGLTQAGDWFYGTTILNDGTIFRLTNAP